MTREEAIEILQNTMFIAPSEVNVDKAIDMAIEALKDRPKGEWISQRYDDLKISDYCCSVCGTYRDDIENYCPNCGADMRGGTK